MNTEYEHNGRAMGTEFSVAIVCDSQERAQTLSQYAEETIRMYEGLFSRFLPESELSRLNTHKTAVVSEIFLEVVLEAQSLFTHTKGIFNPLVQIERLGYTKNFDDLTGDDADFSNEPYDIDFSATAINQQTRIISLQPGQRLDFGGFLKGYLAERICKEIKASSPFVTGVVVNIGGDIHTQGLDAQGEKFIFYIHNPILENSDVPITVHNESLATSGTYKRTWQKKGMPVHHHILDASGTQNPESEVVSASVVHPHGGSAEAYTKVVLSLGPTQTKQVLTSQALKYVVINTDGAVINHTS